MNDRITNYNPAAGDLYTRTSATTNYDTVTEGEIQHSGELYWGPLVELDVQQRHGECGSMGFGLLVPPGCGESENADKMGIKNMAHGAYRGVGELSGGMFADGRTHADLIYDFIIRKAYDYGIVFPPDSR